MPPSRRNLIVIACLCIVAIYLAASVRVYQSISASRGTRNPLLALKYAPYTLPGGPEQAFYDAVKSTLGQATQQVKNIPVQQKPSVPAIPVSAKAFVVGDVETGKIYYSKNPKQVLPVASMSKLITAFVATDTIGPDVLIEISPDEATLPPDGSHLVPGEKFPMKTLLYPLLLSSSNMAAEAIASSTGHRGDFLELMSSYAWEVGMPSIFFADASGISPYNAAAGEDLFALARYLYKFRPDILEITRTPFMTIATTTDHGSHDVLSTHPFVNDPDFIGGKTGRTPEAGETMLTVMKIHGHIIAIVVLGSELGGREGDTRVLIEKVKGVI